MAKETPENPATGTALVALDNSTLAGNEEYSPEMRERWTFKAALALYVKYTNKSLVMARVVAEKALLKFAKHGDLTQCQAFFDAIPANYGRKPAFAKWLVAHAPVSLDDNKFFKDKENAEQGEQGPNSVKISPAAFEKPFWEFAPEKPDVVYSVEDIDKAVRAALSRFHGKKYNAEDTRSVGYLSAMEAAIAGVRASGVGNIPPSEMEKMLNQAPAADLPQA